MGTVTPNCEADTYAPCKPARIAGTTPLFLVELTTQIKLRHQLCGPARIAAPLFPADMTGVWVNASDLPIRALFAQRRSSDFNNLESLITGYGSEHSNTFSFERFPTKKPLMA
jgi:hypothetical protein